MVELIHCFIWREQICCPRSKAPSAVDKPIEKHSVRLMTEIYSILGPIVYIRNSRGEKIQYESFRVIRFDYKAVSDNSISASFLVSKPQSFSRIVLF